MEPLADAHVHLHLTGNPDPEVRRTVAGLNREAALAGILETLQECRARGIAVVRDAGGPRALALEAARIANRHPERYAGVAAAGEPLCKAGGYGGFLARGAEDLGEALRRVEENRQAGAAYVKILATGANSLEEPGAVGPVQFSREELSAITRESKNAGLGVMVHANGPLGGILGCRPDTLEHGFWLEKADIEFLAEERIAWTPTLAAWAALAERTDLTGRQRDVQQITYSRHRQEVAQGASRGIRLLAGSDAGTPGVPHGEGLLGEVERLAEAGLSRTRALAASTWSSRILCEKALGRRLGGLEVGKKAGFVWVASDPVQDPTALRNPLGVYIGGEWTRCLPHSLP
ncbi:MAG: amidohydrolase family protein [Thermodesulfobacteriota bacterium]